MAAKLRCIGPRIPTLDTRTAVPPPKQTDSFYSSTEWKAFRETVKRERGSRCEEPGCRHVGFVYADHVVELQDGGAPLDRRNIMLRCATHHTLKTNRERDRRMAR